MVDSLDQIIVKTINYACMYIFLGINLLSNLFQYLVKLSLSMFTDLSRLGSALHRQLSILCIESFYCGVLEGLRDYHNLVKG